MLKYKKKPCKIVGYFIYVNVFLITNYFDASTKIIYKLYIYSHLSRIYALVSLHIAVNTLSKIQKLKIKNSLIL